MIAKRYRVLLISLAGLAMFTVTLYILRAIGIGLTYQVTPSMPQGWYLLLPKPYYQTGQAVAFYPPKSSQQFLIQHHWLPKSGMMIKYVLAIQGDYVCNHGSQLVINQQVVGQVMQQSPGGIVLPRQEFCRFLQKNEYLLGNTKVSRSFDGRYFGPVVNQRIIAQAMKL